MNKQETLFRTIWAKAIELGFQFNETDAHDMILEIKSFKEYQKYKVCTDCLSIGITYRDCRCTYMKGYPVVELEFEVCACCNNTKDHYADTEFNIEQLKNLYQLKDKTP